MSRADEDTVYWENVRQAAEALGADGCSGVPEIHRDCCLEHDIHYRTGRTITGATLSRAQADALFLMCMQERSTLGRWSPLAWWRYAAVRWFARRHWKGDTYGA